jgi:transcriptional regulator with XRE-family HTH domain
MQQGHDGCAGVSVWFARVAVTGEDIEGSREMTRRTVKDFGPDPIDQHVGARIRARRMGLRMSQTKLGRTVNVTFQQIQKYENGTNRVGASNLYRIATALEVDVLFFYRGLPEEPGGPGECAGAERGNGMPPGDDPMISREAIELVHNYFALPDEVSRKRLFQFVKALADSTGA